MSEPNGKPHTHSSLLALLVLCAACAACSSATTEIKEAWATKLSPAPKTVTLRPAPPPELYFLRLASANLPARNRGGQLYDKDGWPDPFAVLFINDKEVLRSDSVSNTLKPVWKGDGGNFELQPGDELRVDVLDDDPIDKTLIGSAKFSTPTSLQLREGAIELEVIRRGVVKVEVSRAHALIGLGFDYRMAGDEAKVVQVLKHSPAGRTGMKPGDSIVTVAGEKTKKLGHKGLRSALNSVGVDGVEIVVLHEGGTTETMRLKNGPVYPIFSELGGLQ